MSFEKVKKEEEKWENGRSTTGISTTSGFKNFDNIEAGDYEVVDFSFVETKFGKRIKVQTATFFCYLPERFTNFVSKQGDIDELNEMPYTMRYKGKDRLQKNRLNLEFIPMRDSQWTFDDMLKIPSTQKDNVMN